MTQTLRDFIGSLPEDEQSEIGRQADALRGEVASLKELRALSGKAQTEVARVLGIKQPSVSKIEHQTDLYLSTLRSYVEAVGGELELVVTLPDRAPVRLSEFSIAEPTEA